MANNETKQLSADTRAAIQAKTGHVVSRFLAFGVAPGVIQGRFLAKDGKTYQFQWSEENLTCGEEVGG